jgi:hypothetical protein
MKKIKTWEDVCKKVGIDPNNLPTVPQGTPDQIGKHLIATFKLIYVAMALNGKTWKPDWSNSEGKYYPYWDMENGISLVVVDYYCGDSSVPSRLCFKSREIALYAAETFLDLYKDILN